MPTSIPFPPDGSSVQIPDPDNVRRLIDETDERARLLRRLLRLALRLRPHLMTANKRLTIADDKGGRTSG